jgi:hypothetical protein
MLICFPLHVKSHDFWHARRDTQASSRYGWRSETMGILNGEIMGRPKSFTGSRRNVHRVRRSNILVENCNGYVPSVTGFVSPGSSPGSGLAAGAFDPLYFTLMGYAGRTVGSHCGVAPSGRQSCPVENPLRPNYAPLRKETTSTIGSRQGVTLSSPRNSSPKLASTKAPQKPRALADRDHNGDERSERASVDRNRSIACKRFMELFIVKSEAEGV